LKGSKLDTLIDTCIGHITDAGGSMIYPDLLAKIPYEQRQQLPKALKQARVSGQLTQTVELVDGKVVHTYHKV
jgi:hypothetical protein